MMNQVFELPITQQSPAKFYYSFLTGLLFVLSSIVSAEVSNYDARLALESRLHNVERVCEKYEDKLRYEHRILHSVPENERYQTHFADNNHFDHTNKYMYCTNGAYDGGYMKRLRGRSSWLNSNNATKDYALSLRKMQRPEFNEAVKGSRGGGAYGRDDFLLRGENPIYKRIIVVENPLLKFVDYYQHYFVHTPRQTEGYTEGVVTNWLLHRSEKMAKDMGKGEGEKYFEISDLKNGILTFKQFITFITNAPSETMMGKKLVSDSTGFTSRWEPAWKRCTPCVEDYHYMYIVDSSHLEEDLSFVMHTVLDIKNTTDSEPLKLDKWEVKPKTEENDPNAYQDWVYPGLAKDHMKTVERFYSTLTKSEIRALYEKYRLDFELFGYKPDLFISFGMSDETTPAYDL